MGLRDWLLGETYKVNCPDGRQLSVYRDIDKVFPLQAHETDGRARGGGSAADKLKVDIDVGLKNSIALAFVSIDELNNSVMLEMRGAYIAFKNDPCSNSDFYNREIVVIREMQNSLKSLRLHATSVIEFLNRGGDSVVAREMLSKVLRELKISDVATDAANEIEDARAIAEKMGDGQ